MPEQRPACPPRPRHARDRAIRRHGCGGSRRGAHLDADGLPASAPRRPGAGLGTGRIRIVEGPVTRLVIDNDQLQGVELGSTVIPRTAVFVRPRFVPNTNLLKGLGCAMDENGWVVHDPVGRTSVAGAWVTGNAADPRAQVTAQQGKDQPQRSPLKGSWGLT